MSMISFYNITILYYFLFIRTLPSFARMFIFSMAYIFFNRGSVTDILYKIEWFKENVQVGFDGMGI